MYQQLSFRTLVLAVLSLLSISACVLCFTLFLNENAQKSTHQLLMAQIQNDTDLVLVNSDGLLKNDKALVRLQKNQGSIISAFQTLQNGSLKDGLSPMDAFISAPIEPLQKSFNTFSKDVTRLLHDRSTLDRIKQDKEQFLQSITILIDKANGIVAGLNQFNPSNDHISAAYETALSLSRYHNTLIAGFFGSGAISALPMDELRYNLGLLSTDSGAPKSSTIRRSAANLLAGIEEHHSQSAAVENYNQLSRTLNGQISELTKTQQNLSHQLESISLELNDSFSYWLYLMVLLGVMALVGIFLLGLQLGISKIKAQPLAELPPAPGPEAEKTSQTEHARFKTEKNLLMNDIKPLADGILYIKADEHLTSTGDVARCLNQSRESLARRIAWLQSHAAEIQCHVSEKQNETIQSKETPTFSINTKPVEDLTLRANAELDGLQRKVKSLNHPDKDEIKSILIRALRAERMLDEIRVRIRKGWSEEFIEQTGDDAAQNNADRQKDQVTVLINEMVSNLNEFKLQAPSRTLKR